MALEFYKRRFRIPSKRVQYILAFTALLLAIVLVFSWMSIRRNIEEMQDSASGTSSSPADSNVYTAEDEGRLLVVINAENSLKFFVIHTDPANSSITVTTMPEQAVTVDGLSLTPLYQKHGAAYIVNRITTLTDQPLRHYAVFTAENAGKWFARLGDELLFTLNEDIVIHDENGISATLSAGEQTLTATQATTLLCNPNTNDKLVAELVAEMLKQHLHSGRNLTADFSYLANIALTSLRIGDFNAYHNKLTYLAEQNQHGATTITAQVFVK